MNSNILSRRIKYNFDNILHAAYGTTFLQQKNKILNITQIKDIESPFKNTITITTQSPHGLDNSKKRDFIITGIEFKVNIKSVKITNNYNLEVTTLDAMSFANAGISNIRISGFTDNRLNQKYTVHLKNIESLYKIVLVPTISIKDVPTNFSNAFMNVTTFKRVWDVKNTKQTGVNRQLNEAEINIINSTQFSYEIDYNDYFGIAQPINAYIGFSNICVYHANTEITKLVPESDNHIVIYLPQITTQSNPTESIGVYAQDQSRQKQSIDIRVMYSVSNQEQQYNLDKIDNANNVIFFMEKILFAKGVNLNTDFDTVIKESIVVDNQAVDFLLQGFTGWSATFSFMVLKTWDTKLLNSTDSAFSNVQGYIKPNGENQNQLITPIIEFN